MTEVSFLPPTATKYEIKRRQRGVVPWAVQKALNTLENPQWNTLSTDGIFGAATEQAVKLFQESRSLFSDGVVGPATSEKIGLALLAHSSLGVANTPNGLMWGQVEGESGMLIGAVNTSVPGGTDCGYAQRRVYEADYGNPVVVKRAFNGLYQFQLLANGLRSRHDSYFGKTGARTHEMAWKLASLHHNYPSATVKIVNVGIGGLSSYYTTPQQWVLDIGVNFPISGDPVRTPLEWCQFYALGRGEDPGVTTHFVDSWTP